MRVAILNVVESGHNALNAVKKYLPENEEAVFAQNLFAGKLSVSKELLERAVDKTDKFVAAAVQNGTEKIYFVYTGPFILAYVVLQRILRAASGVPVVIAWFDAASKKYRFFDVDELEDLLRKPFLSGE